MKGRIVQLGTVLLAVCAAWVGLGVLAGRVLRGNAPEIAFVRGQNDLYVLDVEYGFVQPIAASTAPMIAPRWSPDGRELAFTTIDGSGNTRIQHIDSVGKLRELYSAPAPIWSTAWSPEGDRLAFVAADQLYVMDTGGGQPEPLDTRVSTRSYSLSWSPDGDTLAYIGSDRPWVYLLDVNTGGQEKRAISGLPADPLARPIWSPDGERLSFISRLGLYVANADGSGEQRLADTNIPRSPSWSPDGQLAFVSHLRLHIVSPDGVVQRVETGLPVTHPPVWSPDGRWLAFASGSELYLMNPDGSEMRRVTPTTDRRAIYTFAWRE